MFQVIVIHNIILTSKFLRSAMFLDVQYFTELVSLAVLNYSRYSTTKRPVSKMENFKEKYSYYLPKYSS
jgi:hypothetical protein